MNDGLRFELVALFGCYRVNMAETLDVVDMDLTAATMDAVQTAADALLKLSGQGRRQSRTWWPPWTEPLAWCCVCG